MEGGFKTRQATEANYGDLVKKSISRRDVIGPLVLYIAHCPVDLTVKDSSGKVVASVIDNRADYHDSALGDIYVCAYGDEKLIAVPQNWGCVAELEGTDDGTMLFETGIFDPATNEVSDKKSFADVALTDSKMFLAEGNGAAAQLFVMDEVGDKVAAVAADGTEQTTISSALVKLARTAFVYTGAAFEPAVQSVTLNGVTLRRDIDYTVSYSNNINAGKGTVKVSGVGEYAGAATATFTIDKASQSIKAKSVKVAYKAKKLVKKGKLAKTKTINLAKKAKISANTKVKFKKANKAGDSKNKVNAKTGKITIKKGLKKGTFKVKVKLTAAADANYEAAKAKTITVKVTVKK